MLTSVGRDPGYEKSYFSSGPHSSPWDWARAARETWVRTGACAGVREPLPRRGRAAARARTGGVTAAVRAAQAHEVSTSDAPSNATPRRHSR